MTDLIALIKKARQKNIESGGITFTISVPTKMQSMDWLVNTDGEALTNAQFKAIFERQFSLKDAAWKRLANYAVEHFVVGWQNVTELQLSDQASSVPAEFSTALLMLYLDDKPDMLNDIAVQILMLWVDKNQESDAEKKLKPGSSQNESVNSQAV